MGTRGRLTSPSDNTVLGRAVAEVWDIERKAALREGAFSCAKTRKELPALSEPPKFGYARAFQLPGEALKLLEICGIKGKRWTYESGKRILTDAEAPLQVRYIKDLTEPAEFDESFAHAFALRIAMAIGPSIAGSAFDKAGVFREYEAAIGGAQGADAIENPPIEHEESEWIFARFQSGYDHILDGGWEDGG